MSVLWGRYGWRTWLGLVLTHGEKSHRRWSWTGQRRPGRRRCSSGTVWRVATANQDARGRQPNTFPTMLAAHTGACVTTPGYDYKTGLRLARIQSKWTSKFKPLYQSNSVSSFSQICKICVRKLAHKMRKFDSFSCCRCLHTLKQ